MEPRRSLWGRGRAAAQGRPQDVGARRGRHAGALCRQARSAARRRQGRAGPRPGGARVRGPERPARPHRFLCEPALRRRYLRPRAAEILRRHPGEDHRDLLQAPVLSARAQSPRRQGARDGDGAVPSSAITGPGSRICAKRSPISSRTSSSSCSTRRRSPRAAPGTGCSTRP